MPDQSGPQLIPDRYTKEGFWRFLLDTKREWERPEEPRFKQFSENLRNFAVSAVILKAARTMVPTSHFFAIGKYLLLTIGILAVFACTLQLFGLVVVSSHWLLGWAPRDQMMLKADKSMRNLYKAAGQKHLRTRAVLKFCGLLTIPLLFLWAMVTFVLVPL